MLHCIPIWIQFQYHPYQNKNEGRGGCLKRFGWVAGNPHNLEFHAWVMYLNPRHKLSMNQTWNQKKCVTLIKITIGKNVRRRSILREMIDTKRRIFYIKMWKIVLNQLSNWQLNFPGTINSISIGLRKSRWCNHT